MWCKQCHQDVPAVSSSTDDSEIRCARCARIFSNTPCSSGESAETAKRLPAFDEINTQSDNATDSADFSDFQVGELDQVLDEAHRFLRSVSDADASPLKKDRSIRVDAGPPKIHEDSFVEIETAISKGPRHPKSLRSSPQTHSISWPVLTLGLAVFACGAGLMGWALLGERPQLWQLGLPMVLGGQVAVLAVVISQLEAVWQSNRGTFIALHKTDEQVRKFSHLLEDRVLPKTDSEREHRHHIPEQPRPHLQSRKTRQLRDISR